MPELSFRLVRDENGLDGSVEPNACDSGLTETAVLYFEDEQGFGVSGAVSVQINQSPIPHTDDTMRTIDLNTIQVEFDQPDEENAKLYEQLLCESVDLNSAFNQLCRQ